MSENSKTAQRILDEIQQVVVGTTETVEKIRETGENARSTAGTVWDSVRGFLQRVGKTLSALFGE